MCLGERVCVREKRKAVSRMDMCPLSSTLSSPTSSSSSSPPTHLCFSSPSSNSAAPWAPSVPALGEKETRRLDGWLKTELQCQQGIRRKVATNQKVMGHILNSHAQTFTVWLLTTVLKGQHPVILYSVRPTRAVHGSTVLLLYGINEWTLINGSFWYWI